MSNAMFQCMIDSNVHHSF